MKKEDLKAIWDKAVAGGSCTHIAGGIYLQSSKDLQAEQAGWSDEDGQKEVDFTLYTCYITTDDGTDPIGVDTFDGLLADDCIAQYID